MIHLAHLDPRSTQYARTLDTLKFAKEVSQGILCGRHPLIDPCSCVVSLVPRPRPTARCQSQKAHIGFRSKDPKSPPCGIGGISEGPPCGI